MRFKKPLLILFFLALFLTGHFSVLHAHAFSVNVDFLNISEKEVLVLDVGEEYEFKVSVEADEAFTYALMLSDEQFPGRYIKLNGADIVTKNDSALLMLVATGKRSTQDLPDGVAPVSLVVGVRNGRGIVHAETVDFFVKVP